MNVCDNLGDHLVGNVYIKVLHTKEKYLVGLEPFHQLTSVLLKALYSNLALM